MAAISQSDFMQALGWALLNSLWQMALLWLVFHVITTSFKFEKPSHKSALATSLLLSGFAWFVFTFISILDQILRWNYNNPGYRRHRFK